MTYRTIVGLEIHVELSTKTKAFCGCENKYGGEPNTRVCPVCLGMPGALPVLNKEVVEYAAMAGKAFNCTIHEKSVFERKNYFYPDLVKGYQLTQNQHALCNDGYVEIDTEEGKKKIGIHQIQIEEDTGKALHSDDRDTLMDYNRCGVPLIEIVTEPDMASSDEAKAFLEAVRSSLRYLEISDCKMEEGSMRCDVNINVENLETGQRSAIAEVKNLNSFRAVGRAIDFETQRQIDLMEAGGEEKKTTRRWDDVKTETVIMRVKYTENDYRFVPEGDLPPLYVEQDWLDKIVDRMPELPKAKMDRFIKDYKLPDYDAQVLTSSKELAQYYEDLAKDFDDYNMLSNWIMGEVLRRVNLEEGFDLPFPGQDLLDLLKMVKEGRINNNAGKKVLRAMFEEGGKPQDLVEKMGLLQMQDSSAMESFVDQVLAENPESVDQIKAGKDRVLGFLVGQVMKKSKGKANPQVVNQLLAEKIKAL